MAAPPVLIPDYIFMWSFLLSFIGAVFYSIVGLLNLDMTNIVANKNSAMIINIIIGISGIVSIFVWFNMDVPELDNRVLNSKAVKTNVNA